MTPKGQFDITLFALQINLFHKEHIKNNTNLIKIT